MEKETNALNIALMIILVIALLIYIQMLDKTFCAYDHACGWILNRLPIKCQKH